MVVTALTSPIDPGNQRVSLNVVNVRGHQTEKLCVTPHDTKVDPGKKEKKRSATLLEINGI